MTPRRVLLRIKKLKRFLDERISDAARRREAAGDDGDARARAEAAGALEAYQAVRGEMVGERLDLDELELEEEPDAEAESGDEGERQETEEPEASDDAGDGEEAGDAGEAGKPEEREEAPTGG